MRRQTSSLVNEPSGRFLDPRKPAFACQLWAALLLASSEFQIVHVIVGAKRHIHKLVHIHHRSDDSHMRQQPTTSLIAFDIIEFDIVSVVETMTSFGGIGFASRQQRQHHLPWWTRAPFARIWPLSLSFAMHPDDWNQ